MQLRQVPGEACIFRLCLPFLAHGGKKFITPSAYEGSEASRETLGWVLPCCSHMAPSNQQRRWEWWVCKYRRAGMLSGTDLQPGPVRSLSWGCKCVQKTGRRQLKPTLALCLPASHPHVWLSCAIMHRSLPAARQGFSIPPASAQWCLSLPAYCRSQSKGKMCEEVGLVWIELGRAQLLRPLAKFKAVIPVISARSHSEFPSVAVCSGFPTKWHISFLR